MSNQKLAKADFRTGANAQWLADGREKSHSSCVGTSDKASNKVNRDAAWINREYGRDKWPAVLHSIKTAIATGESSLSRLVATLARQEWGNPDLCPINAVALGEQVQLPASLAWHGLYALVAETVMAACRADTQAIVDLGCGWGRSLFEIWLRGGPSAATYHGLEFTQAGLDCVIALAALEPRLTARAARFDFQRPDFSTLARRLSHAVVFTVSSIHQVPIVDKTAYRSILGIADAVDCLHFEQIGWQIATHAQSAPDRDYALRHDYNRNLWQVLSELRDEGAIDVIAAEADLFGTQELYPLSLVHWRRRTPKIG
jgi:hypothetical protein